MVSPGALKYPLFLLEVLSQGGKSYGRYVMASEPKAPCMYIIIVGRRFCHRQSCLHEGRSPKIRF